MALTKAHNRMIESAAVSVKDFGALGDGSTDDTTAIQAAIDSLAEGGRLLFPVGTFKITSTLSITNFRPFVMEGSGNDPATVPSWATGDGSDPSGTVLKFDGVSKAIEISNGYWPAYMDLSNVVIENLRIDGNSTSTDGVYGLNRPNAIIKNTTICNFTNAGIILDRNAFYWHVSNVEIFSTKYGIYSDDTDPHYAPGSASINGTNVENVWIHDTTHECVYLKEAGAFTFSNSVLESAGSAAVNVGAMRIEDCQMISIVGIYTEQVYGNSLTIDTCTNLSVSNCTFKTKQLDPATEEYGIFIKDSNNVRVNNITGKFNDAIVKLENSQSCQVSEVTTISDSNPYGVYGIYVDSTSVRNTISNVHLSAYTVEEIDSVGIYIEGDYNLVTGCNISYCGSSGVKVLGDYNTISNNELFNNNQAGNTNDGGIHIYNGHHNLVTGNYIFDTQAGSETHNYGIYLEGGGASSDNNIITNNVIRSSNTKAISGSFSVLNKNIVDGNIIDDELSKGKTTLSGGAATEVITSDHCFTSSSVVVISPMNSTAAASFKSKGVYVSATAVGNFTLATQDASNFTGGEDIAYIIYDNNKV